MFGLDVKSLVVGIILGWFGIPWLMALINRPRASTQPANA